MTTKLLVAKLSTSLTAALLHAKEEAHTLASRANAYGVAYPVHSREKTIPAIIPFGNAGVEVLESAMYHVGLKPGEWSTRIAHMGFDAWIRIKASICPFGAGVTFTWETVPKAEL